MTIDPRPHPTRIVSVELKLLGTSIKLSPMVPHLNIWQKYQTRIYNNCRVGSWNMRGKCVNEGIKMIRKIVIALPIL